MRKELARGDLGLSIAQAIVRWAIHRGIAPATMTGVDAADLAGRLILPQPAVDIFAASGFSPEHVAEAIACPLRLARKRMSTPIRKRSGVNVRRMRVVGD